MDVILSVVSDNLSARGQLKSVAPKAFAGVELQPVGQKWDRSRIGPLNPPRVTTTATY